MIKDLINQPNNRALAISLFLLIHAANAAVVIDVFEMNGDVIANGAGSLNLQSLSSQGDFSLESGVFPDFGALVVGTDISATVPWWGNVSGPEILGDGVSFVAADITVGDHFGVGANGAWISTPEGYNPEEPLSGTSTWTSQDFRSLGLDEGQYVWTWGSGASADRITINIGAVPEPTTVFFMGSAILGFGAHRRRIS